jgi:hypothetical protein
MPCRMGGGVSVLRLMGVPAIAVTVGMDMAVMVMVIVAHEHVAFLVIPSHLLVTRGASGMATGIQIAETARLSACSVKQLWQRLR